MTTQTIQPKIPVAVKKCPVCHINHIKVDYCLKHNCRQFCDTGKLCTCGDKHEFSNVFFDNCRYGDCMGYRCNNCGGLIL